MSESGRPNRLIHETSPYLLQHARNPVDWYPWGEEALRASREQDKPIFLSIGYSACHWCHVMERESFENPATAQVMNDLFINIKVDREERPDLDQIYMTATQLMTPHGGWPMSVWLSPDLKPFYAGTYFPPEPRHGMSSFVAVCQHLGRAWKERRPEVVDSAEEVTRRVRQLNEVRPGVGALDVQLIVQGSRALARYIDPTYGGLGTAPKFPHSTELRLILRGAAMTKSEDLLQLVELTLDHMVRGGMYDQVGGGFHRYSTDQRWLVPHFEKMLYDNALIPLACIETAQLTADDSVRRLLEGAVQQTLDYVLREMQSPEGPFYSTQDADSEGEEGKFFVWTLKEVEEVLGPELAKIASYAFDVSPGGNWEGNNILHWAKPIPQTAKLLGMSEAELGEAVGKIRCKLFGARARRVHPGRDEKILTSWNGMMIDTLAVADGGVNGPYAAAAVRAAEYILGVMRTPAGLLFRTAKEGRARLNGYLEDYAYLANGLVSLYEATFDPRWIREALATTETMIEQFWDEADGGFFYTGRNHEALIARGKDPQDGAIPSGNAMAATALARLVKLTGRSDLAEKVERTLSLFSDLMSRSPMAGAQMLIALGIYQGPTDEIALVADPGGAETQKALGALRRRFVPRRVLALRRPDQGDADVAPVELLAGKSPTGPGLTAYFCRDFSCQAPVEGLPAFLEHLERGRVGCGPAFR